MYRALLIYYSSLDFEISTSRINHTSTFPEYLIIQPTTPYYKCDSHHYKCYDSVLRLRAGGGAYFLLPGDIMIFSLLGNLTSFTRKMKRNTIKRENILTYLLSPIGWLKKKWAELVDIENHCQSSVNARAALCASQ